MFWLGFIIGMLLGFIGGFIFLLDKIENMVCSFGEIEFEKADEDELKDILDKKNKEDK